MKNNRKAAAIIILFGALLLGGLLFVASGTNTLGPSPREELVQAWLDEGLTLAEAERLAAEGAAPVDSPRTDPLPATLRSSAESDKTAENTVSEYFLDFYDPQVSEKMICEGIENEEACQQVAEEAEGEEIPEFSRSDIFLETEEEVVVVLWRCQRGQSLPPLFSSVLLRGDLWEPRYLFASQKFFEEDVSGLTEQGKADLQAMADSFQLGCKNA